MNKSIWELYINSERGKKAIELFTLKDDDSINYKIKEIYHRYSEYFGGDGLEDYVLDNAILFYFSIISDKLFFESNETAPEYFEKLIDRLEIHYTIDDEEGNPIRVEGERPIIYAQDYRSYCAILSEISLILYFELSEEFFPILFREQFDVFMKILDVLNIPMPNLPSKSDKRGRLLLYSQINENIKLFARENGLTPAETCACLYDFAFMLLENEKDTALPEPTNIWLTGGSKGDYKTFLENPVKGAKSVWTCNENTKRGDIIVMYVLSPYSCIQSIWRADIDGVYTPFGYYNSRTRATDGIVIPKITLNELKTDPYFSQLGIVRKNFQGVNGVRFSATDYNELKRLLTEKGFDTSVLPQLYQPDLEFEKKLKNEKEVEENLLIPLLEKLGFSSIDWSRQISQKAGRTEKAIPDFVFLPQGEIHFQNAPMVIEAKFDISSNIERTKAYNQALSYARMMKSKIMGICDKERLIIYKEKKGNFDRFNPIFEKHWQKINEAETFNYLKQIIGKEVVKKMI